VQGEVLRYFTGAGAFGGEKMEGSPARFTGRERGDFVIGEKVGLMERDEDAPDEDGGGGPGSKEEIVGAGECHEGLIG
jgi:hypothetical protein